MALGIMMVMAIVVASVSFYTAENSSQAAQSSADQKAYNLAEEGLNDAYSVLNSTIDANNPGLLPATSSGTPDHFGIDGPLPSTPELDVYGDYNVGTRVWTITSTATIANISGPTNLSHTIRGTVTLTPAPIQTIDPVNAAAWNWVYERSGSTNDNCGGSEYIQGSAIVSAPVYAKGDLCVQGSSIVQTDAGMAPVVIDAQGYIRPGGSDTIGTAGTHVSAVHTGLGCFNGHVCGAADRVFANTSDMVAPAVVRPVAAFNTEYTIADPGPNHPCTTAVGVSATWWDNDAARNASNPQQDLTPGASYTCTDANGGLIWDNAAKTLTIKGAVFFDGNASMTGNVTIKGLGAIYVNGTFTLTNNATHVCTTWNGPDCGWTNLAPDTNMPYIITNNNCAFGNSREFQGGIYCVGTFTLSNTAQWQGPVLADYETLNNTAYVHGWPTLTYVPIGLPGNAAAPSGWQGTAPTTQTG
jgi:hypothetical protein